jgi:HD-like signal output (HDOD) protein
MESPLPSETSLPVGQARPMPGMDREAEAGARTAPEQRTREVTELPPLSPVANQLLALLSDEDVNVNVLARTIELDPGLTARIVGLGRSAFFGYAGAVYTVRDAIVRVLGLKTVKSLALTLALSRRFPVDPRLGLDMPVFWATSLLTADAARNLAPKLALDEAVGPEAAYLAGLLHDLGLLVMAHLYPTETAEVFAAASGATYATAAVLDVETRLIGTNHHRLGSLIAERWHLPPEVVVTLGHYHRRDYRGRHWACARLVGACSIAARRWLGDPGEGLAGEDDFADLAVPPAALDRLHVWATRQVPDVRELAATLAR